MEGGSPALIWERWTLPLYYQQVRYWNERPPLRDLAEMFARAYLKWKPPKRMPRKMGGDPVERPRPWDWSLLDEAPPNVAQQPQRRGHR